MTESLSPAMVLAQPQELFNRLISEHLQVRVGAILRVCNAAAGRRAGPTDGAEAADAPGNASLPAPPEDDELREMQAQVQKVSEEVAAYRATVPAFLADQLAENLVQCRPMDAETAELAGNDGAADDARPSVAASASAAPHELSSQLADNVIRLPALRAKLEEALERMERVVAAVEGETSRPSPKTIERVLLRGGGASGSVCGVSPAFKHALESGQIGTRRRAARDLRPIPYMQH